ncbi:MAG TPA: S8 family serine peptidase [Gemmatimonadaceae bacterium]|nr:S8 family serine peptidase [Gemmatimonadaceae bacterium]
MPGIEVSFNTITLVLQPGATVGEANALLDAQKATIVGGFPGKPGSSAGVLVLRLATATHEQLIARLEELRKDSRVRHVVQDAMLAPAVVARANTVAGPPAAWTWFLTPAGDNWGMEMIRAPQMWNLNDAIRKGGARLTTLVLDAGFQAGHPDLVYLNQPTQSHAHGTHVAGTIGATFDNGLGVDGVNPFAEMMVRYGVGPTASWAELLISIVGPLLRASASSPMRVINTSLAFNWSQQGINASTDATVQDFVGETGAVIREGLATLQSEGIALPVWVTAAGNDAGGALGNQVALWASPMSNAALEHATKSIIVVESDSLAGNGAAGETTRSVFSNIGGHISAPGSRIMSTSTSPAYDVMSGTSMASPHVAGLVGYLYALEPALPNPTLDANPILDLLLANAVPASGGARPRIDAFASAMDVDRVLGGSSVLKKLVDIDDGTPDGNQRTNADGTEFTTDAHGDGKVSMADFRRWRDWALQIHEPQTQFLDGSANHVKRDVNRDGVVALGALEDIYSRGDFNGDGELTIDSTASFVPGAIRRRVTDLEVLQELFSDPDYDKAELPELIRSGDVHMDATSCLTLAGTASVRSTVQLTGSATLTRPARTHSTASPRQIYTIPVSAALGTSYQIRMEARDANGGLLGSTQTDTLLMLGQDIRFRPNCTPLVNIAISPASVALQPGKSQQFTATVTGTANTAVTWSQTGGSITQNGLFTAGQSPGSYQVTATSVADQNKKASAAVTIQIQAATIALDSIEGRLDATTQVNSSSLQPVANCDSTRFAPKNVASDSASVRCSGTNTGVLASTATAVARQTFLFQPANGGSVSSLHIAVASEGTADTQSGGGVFGDGTVRQSVCFRVSAASVSFAATGALSAQPSTYPYQGNGSANATLWSGGRPVFQAVVGTSLNGASNPNAAALNQSGTLTPGLYCLQLTAIGFAFANGQFPSDRASGSADVTVTLTP